MAGGLKHATELSWSSPVRLCILFADAPCHGKKYHDFRDQFPEGCPQGVDPSEMIYKLQYDLGVDFYFIRIVKGTDKMVSVFQSTVLQMAARDNEARHDGSSNSGGTGGPKFVVHDLNSDAKMHNLGDSSGSGVFVDTVVESVKGSAGRMNLRLEKYS